MHINDDGAHLGEFELGKAYVYFEEVTVDPSSLLDPEHPQPNDEVYFNMIWQNNATTKASFDDMVETRVLQDGQQLTLIDDVHSGPADYEVEPGKVGGIVELYPLVNNESDVTLQFISKQPSSMGRMVEQVISIKH
ncbi:hypothetical protein D2E26_1351 [Bifidobacterium dolichotidis]|uniref:Uncharacterized protein n=1 Tax=Bifidobacterium dolichotidis TaxID=2306976 RepID=A0A430FNZ9_9BIFI|nr:hypothetical protein D2E26_1351 [Bifidobacterium dolichotidis]